MSNKNFFKVTDTKQIGASYHFNDLWHAMNVARKTLRENADVVTVIIDIDGGGDNVTVARDNNAYHATVIDRKCNRREFVAAEAGAWSMRKAV